MFEKVKNEAVKQGISLNKLARMANMAQPDLSCALSGKKPFYPNWRKRVSEVLGVPEDELFDE